MKYGPTTKGDATMNSAMPLITGSFAKTNSAAPESIQSQNNPTTRINRKRIMRFMSTHNT
jgi:hypothetical protein